MIQYDSVMLQKWDDASFTCPNFKNEQWKDLRRSRILLRLEMTCYKYCFSMLGLEGCAINNITELNHLKPYLDN